MKRNLKKVREKSKRQIMRHEDFKLHERIIKNRKGHEEVVLDARQYRRLMKDYRKLQTLVQNQKILTQPAKESISFRSLRGFALQVPPNPYPLFKTEDDLWN